MEAGRFVLHTLAGEYCTSFDDDPQFTPEEQADMEANGLVLTDTHKEA